MSTTSESPLQDTYVLDEDNDKQWVADTDVFTHAVEHGQQVDPGHVVISADPGAGKSYAALTKLPDLVDRFIFVADSKPLADQLGEDHDMPVVHNDARSTPPRGETFITIPHHVPKYTSSEIILVVDEWHSVITHYGYKRETIDEFTDTFSEFKQIIGLTGTEYVPASRATTVEVKTDSDPINIEPVTYRKIWSAIMSEVERRPDRTHFISLFDKNSLKDGLIDVLKGRGYSAEEITEFNSETKDDEEIANFKETNLFADDTEIVFTTYTQGLDIDGDHYTAHIAPFPGRRHHPIEIAQFIQRFREAEDFDVKLYFSSSSPPMAETFRVDNGEFIGDQKTLAKKQIRKYREALAGLKAKAEPLDDPEKLTDIQKEIIEDREEYRYKKADDRATNVNLVTEELDTNETQMYHNRYQIEAEAACRSVKELRQKLERHGVRLLQRKHDDTTLSEDTSRTQRSSVEKDGYEEHVESLMRGEDDDVPREVRARAIELSKYYDKNNIEKVMKRVGHRTRDWNDLREKLKIRDPDKELEEPVRKIYDIFEVGNEYSSAEIKEKLEEIPKFDEQITNKQNSTEILKEYFETEKEWSNQGRGRQILSDNPLPVSIDKSREDRRENGRIPYPDFLT